jgi:hypothetical protein
VRLASPIGSAAGGIYSVNLSTSLPNVAKLAAHPKFVWVFNANCDGTIIYNDPVCTKYFKMIVVSEGAWIGKNSLPPFHDPPLTTQ